MKELKFNVVTGRDLTIGYQGEDNSAVITFQGWTMDDPSNTMWLIWNGREKLRIPLMDFQCSVDAYMTQYAETATCCLEERSGVDGATLIAKSKLFKLKVAKSVFADDQAEVVDTRLELIYTNYKLQYDKMIALENNLKGKEADRDVRMSAIEKTASDNERERDSKVELLKQNAEASLDLLETQARNELATYKTETYDALQSDINTYKGATKDELQASLQSYETSTSAQVWDRLQSYTDGYDHRNDLRFNELKTQTTGAVNDAITDLEQKRDSGYFDGKDYVITDADYNAIANKTKELVPPYDDTELRAEITSTKESLSEIIDNIDLSLAGNINAYINIGSALIYADDNRRTAYFRCKPNTTYTISKTVASSKFVVGQSEKEPTSAYTTRLTSTPITVSDESIVLTTDATANFISVYYYNADSTPSETILESISVTGKGGAKDITARESIENIKNDVENVKKDLSELTDVFVHSENLLDYKEVTKYGILSQYSSAITREDDETCGYMISPFIAIDENQTYVKSFDSTYALYDKDMLWIAGGKANKGVGFITPTNSRYIRLTINESVIKTETLMCGLFNSDSLTDKNYDFFADVKDKSSDYYLRNDIKGTYQEPVYVIDDLGVKRVSRINHFRTADNVLVRTDYFGYEFEKGEIIKTTETRKIIKNNNTLVFIYHKDGKVEVM